MNWCNSLRFLSILALCSGVCSCSGQQQTQSAAATATPTPAASATRPAKWAVPLHLDEKGLPNANRVSANLIRGAQPTDAGYAALKEMGVKTVICLRSFNTDREEVEAAGLRCVNIYMKAWHPEDEDVQLFLETIADESNGPYFVHCLHGADRTGTMCALYRIGVDGWTNEEAITEMREGGYGFHSVWKELIEYIRAQDAEELRARVKALREKK